MVCQYNAKKSEKKKKKEKRKLYLYIDLLMVPAGASVAQALNISHIMFVPMFPEPSM